MRLLLDTHVLIWLAEDTPRLKSAARKAILDPANEVLVSLATIWEIAIKQSKGRLAGNVETLFRELPSYGFVVLPIQPSHVLATRSLDHHHGDPFDRLLIAQASVEKLSIVTHDDAFRPYGVPILWT